MYKNYLEIDDIDKKILTILMKDAKTPFVEIARQIHVSASTIHVRMNKLEQMQATKGFYLELDLQRLGYDISAFIGVILEKSSFYDDVVSKLKAIPEISEAYYTSGTYNVLIKVTCRDTEHLHKVLSKKIQKISGVQRTETILSLEESIKRPVNIQEESE